MIHIDYKKLQPGMAVKRNFWNLYRTVKSIDADHGIVYFNDDFKSPWYGDFFIEEQPNSAKIGDIITGPPNSGWKYIVYEVDGPFVVRLSTENGVKLGTWFDLRYQHAWSINGVKCSEFFGRQEIEPAPIPVEVPKRKKRIYNA